MKILYVAVDTPIPGTHGGSIHVQELCQALSRRGHEVHLLAPPGAQRPSAPSPGSDSEDQSRVEHHHLAQPPRFLEWMARGRVRRLAETLRPDVVVDRFYTFGGAGIWAAHSLRIPAVLEVNSPARPVDGFWRDRLDRLTLVRPIDRWRRTLLRWSDHVYTTSRHLVPPDMQDDVTVVTNGVDIKRFRPGTAGTPAGPLRCVYVSSFRSWHGAEDLVGAVALCHMRGVDLEVTCLGQGPRWDAATRAARDAGLDDTIRFVGAVAYDDVPRYLAEADVGLAPFSPSSFSALELGWFWSPVKIFEYLAAGLVVTTIDTSAMRELLPGSVARFYPAGDRAEFAATLERLASDRRGVCDAQRAARSLAESRYTWGHQATIVDALLRRVVDR